MYENAILEPKNTYHHVLIKNVKKNFKELNMLIILS